MSTTKRQKQILDYINRFSKNNGYSPSFEEIAKHFRLSAVSGIHQHIQALKDKGYLSKQKNQPRGIEISKSEKLISIPLLGTIAAGQPIALFDIPTETIAVPKSKIPSSSEVYALRVAGDSMVDENINDGDMVLIKQQSTAENGQKIVALINNNEATLKKFYKEHGRIRLQPANKSMEPILINTGTDLAIQGVVVDVLKNNPFTPGLILPAKKEEVKKYSKLPLNQIICGDAVEELKKIPNDSCDVIIIDPPYNIGKDFGNNYDKRELNEYVVWCKKWINECIRTMKPTGTMFIYGFSEILAHLSVEIPINKRWLIWHYTNKNVASLNFWQRSHEAIICAWKNKPIFNRDKIREPYTAGFLNGAAGKIRKGTLGRFSKGGKETIYKAHDGGALPRDVIKISSFANENEDVIKIPALAGGAGMVERWFLCKTCNNVFEPRQLSKHVNHEITKHPTQKPFGLSKKLIKSAIPQKDGVVLVPFVGSGSECAAAKELGHSYVGFELNPDYIKIAKKMTISVKRVPKLF